MDSVGSRDSVDKSKGSHSLYLEPEVPVFVEVKFGIKPTAVVANAAMKQYRVDGHKVAVAQLSSRVWEVENFPLQRTSLVDTLHFSVHCSHITTLPYRKHQLGDVIRVEPIIVVEEYQILATRRIQTGVCGLCAPQLATRRN